MLVIHDEDGQEEEELSHELEMLPTNEGQEDTILAGICLNSVLGVSNPKP